MSSERPMSGALSVGARCVVAGVCLAGSLPPWGWWPLAFVGFALLDRLVAGATRRQRAVRTWLVCAAWLFPAMLWMVDLTPPGYVIAGALYSLYFAAGAALVPPDGRRRLALPAVFVLGEWARWHVPFGGVPLANLALSQVETPLGQTARLLGPLLVIALVVVIGQALSAVVVERVRLAPAIAAGLVGVALLGAVLHPRAEVVGELDAAVVQGGGPTRTRASSTQQPVVLARHVEATRSIPEVDLVLWPENVVNPGRFLAFDEAVASVASVAVDAEATVLAGWFYAVNDGTATVNYQAAVTPDGVEVDRYDKVRIVPFGEFVPLRGLIEQFSDEIPSRDVIPGTGPAVLETPEGTIGVAISWEAFFERRSRDAVRNGAELLTNPTNGSSYWLTQVHTQQVASNQLRAIENDRWLLMAGPTGLSAVIDPSGDVRQRTGIGERAVLVDTVELRRGRTLASLVGPWPVLLATMTALLAANRGTDPDRDRLASSRTTRRDRGTDPDRDRS